MSIGVRFLLFCGLFLAAICSNLTEALAQGGPLPSPSNPVWTTVVGNGNPNATAPSPDKACRLQHAYYNPGAVYLPPVKTEGREDRYVCQWLSSQMPGGSGDTSRPTEVRGGCGNGNILRKGMCVDARTETPDCGGCGADGGVPLSPPAPLVGDPINVMSGHQIEMETDYITGDGRFGVTRRYSSNTKPLMSEGQFGFGTSWSGLIPGRLFMIGQQAEYVNYERSNGGAVHVFRASNANNLNDWTFAPISMTSMRLTTEDAPAVDRPNFLAEALILNGSAELQLTKDNGEHILFRRAGPKVGLGRYAIPIEQGTPNGYRIFYEYPDTEYYPNRIHDTDGREMLLTWRAAPIPGMVGRYPEATYKVIEKIVLPDTTELHYAYNDAATVISGTYSLPGGGNSFQQSTIPGHVDRLISVRRKTATGTVLWGRDYLYGNDRFPYALTGIKDLAGNRLNTFVYDAAGQVASSEMSGGVLRHTMQSLLVDANRTAREVTNPLGRTERYNTFRIPGNAHIDSPRVLENIVGSATATVAADEMSFVYIQPTSFTADHTLVSMIDRNGFRTTIDADLGPARRPNGFTEAKSNITLAGTNGVELLLPEQRQTNVTYWPNSNLPASITRGTLKTEYTYTPGGQVLTATLIDLSTQTVPYATGGQTRTTTYTWKPNGRLESVNGPLPVDAQGKDDTATFEYDTSGNLLSVTNGLGHVTSFSDYDLNGRPRQSTDANSIITRFEYDPLGRLKSATVKHPTTPTEDAVTLFDYDAEGRVTAITRPATDTMIMDYNLAGQLTAIRAASGERIDFEYNAAGGVTAQTVKRINGSTSQNITRSFDSLNRMLTETLGAGRTTTWAYDKEGNPELVISARNNATQMAFDGLNRLISTTHPGGGAEGLGYTPLDDVASSTDAIAVTTNFVRNGFGETIQEISPDRGTSVYYYNAAGQVSSVIDGRGQRIDYTRDILGRVTIKTPIGRPASEVVSYIWDTAALAGSYTIGRLARVDDNSGNTRFGYDHRGNLVQRKAQVTNAGLTTAFNLNYSYDLSDRILQTTYPSGRLVAYDRDSKGRVLAIRTKASAATTAWTNIATGMAYEPFASLKSATLGNALTMTNSWGNDGRLAFRRLKASGGVNRSLLTYAYDNDDNITGITDNVTPSNSRTFGYDARGRLAQTLWQSGSFAREDIIHDANGNRTAVERRIGANDNTAAQIDIYTRTAGSNKLASIDGTFGNRSIAYDARGNTLGEMRSGGIAVTTAYDGHGRLISLTRTGEEDQTNIYNGMDERVLVSSGVAGGGMTTRRFVYDPDGRVLGEYGSSALDVIAERIWMNPEVADSGMFGGDDGTGGYAPIAIVTGTTLSWVHANHMGVPQLDTDASGAIIATPNYTLPGFPGQFRTFADLYYNKYRDYDVSTGRYIQADPIGLAGGQSPYGYAMGNPLRYTDPTGEFVPAVIVAGFLIGSGSEFLIQLGSNFWNGHDVFDRNCYDLGEIALAGGFGALGGGLGTLRTLRFATRSLTRETGFEWSHFIPRKVVNLLPRGRLRGALNKRGGVNGRWVTPQQHYRHDPFRYPSEWREMPDRFRHGWQRGFDRTPAWLRGLGAGSGVGVGGGEGDGG